jgi:outer membrane autotransporter protein
MLNKSNLALLLAALSNMLAGEALGGDEISDSQRFLTSTRLMEQSKLVISGLEEFNPDSVLIDGTSFDVLSSDPTKSYAVINGGSLYLKEGASANNVIVVSSLLNMREARVDEGVYILDGVSEIDRSEVRNSAGVGVVASMYTPNTQHGASVKISDSQISGTDVGLLAGPLSKVTVSNSRVGSENDAGANSGMAIRMASSDVFIRDGSVVEGARGGVRIIDGLESYLDPAKQRNYLVVDGSVINGGADAALIISNDQVMTNIYLTRGSQLISSSNNLIRVDGAGTSILTADNVILAGGISAADDSDFNLVLKNQSLFDGDASGIKHMVISEDARWRMHSSNSVNAVTMDGGSIGFSGEGFHSLKLGSLSGRGLFDMRINLDSGEGDLLDVAGKAEGRYRLRVQNTGVEAVPESFEALRVVHTEGGNAEFGLLGGRADLGVYSYELQRQGTDWFIVGSGKVISPSTQSALALFNAAPTVWNSELTTLRSRLGEVRGSEEGGGWMRSYGNRFNASLDSGVSYEQKQQGLSFGADAPVPVSDGHLMVGVMGGYSKSDLDIGRGTSGQVDSYYVGAYGTWLSDNGYYVDGVLKLNQFHNESNVAMSDGTKAKGDYSNTALGGSIEVGKHVKLADGYFVEPFVQMSSVWIDGDSYTLDNGLQADTGRTQSVLGKIGSTVGRSFVLEDGGVVQPYVRAALAHEFSRNNEVKVNGQRFDNGLFGSRAELGAGVSVSLSERLQVHADFDYMKGEHVEQPWGANVGLRLAF